MAAYIGNPSAHNLSFLTYGPVLLRALGSQNIFTASTVDQMPKQVVRRAHVRPPPERAGARRRPLRPPADPRRQPARVERQPADGARTCAAGCAGSASAAARSWWWTRAGPGPPSEADEHHFIRPGQRRACCSPAWRARSSRSRWWIPGALAEHVRRARRGVRAGARATRPSGWRRPRASRPARSGGWRASWRRAERAAVYARIGTTTQEFGTHRELARGRAQRAHRQPRPRGRRDVHRWPPRASATRTATPGSGRGVRLGRWQSRVRGLAEAFGELPVACLAEEIDTPGEGQVRALITWPGNPVVSTPNSGRLERAVEELDFMLAMDIYVNETTRHADVILPAPGAAREVALRPGALPARRAQRGQLLAAAAASTTAPPSGRCSCAWPAWCPARDPTPTWRRSTGS